MAEQDKPVLQKRILAVQEATWHGEAPIKKGKSRFRAPVQLLTNPHANIDLILNSTANLVRNHTFPHRAVGPTAWPGADTGKCMSNLSQGQMVAHLSATEVLEISLFRI